MVSQIALAFVLLAGASLLLRSMSGLLSVELDREARGLALVNVSFPSGAQDLEEAYVYFQDLERRIRGLPGVLDVGAADQMPFSGGFSMPPVTVGTHEGEVDRILHLPTVTPAYLNTIDIPVLAAAFRGIREEMDPEGTRSFGDLEPVIDGSVAVVSAGFSVLLLGGLASLVAFQALFGIHGVLAYLVQLNARSIGIQMALGGPPSCFFWRGWWPAGYPDARPPGWIRWRFSRGTDGRPQGSPVVGIVAAPLFYPYSVPWN